MITLKFYAEPYVISQQINAATQADAVRHLHARTALIKLLLDDDRTMLLYKHWDQISGFEEACKAWRLAADKGTKTEEISEEARKAYEAIVTMLESWEKNLVPETLLPETVRFIQETLGLPLWGWLVLEIINRFIAYVRDRTRGVEMLDTEWIEQEQMAPEINIKFATEQGETAEHAYMRAKELFEPILKQLKTSEIERGHIPKMNDDGYDTPIRYVGWFYRSRVCKESLNKIAKSDTYDRKTVRRGIEEAERLLSLAN